MELIITTEEKIEEIINRCLANHSQVLISEPKPETHYLHSINQLARFLNCSPATAQKLKNSGKIRYKQFGRKCVFNTTEVLEDLSKVKRR
jgi:hypothetical protein